MLARVPHAEGFIEVDHGRLHYEIGGEGDAIVLLHGFALDARMWDAEAAHFATSHCVVRYDLRGYGKSTLPAAPFAHHADLHAVLAALGIARAHVVGLSMGGGVALDFALVHPELVRSLVLVDTIVGGFKFSENAPQMGAAWAAAKTGGVPAARAAWLDNPLFAPARRSPAVAGRLRTMVDEYSGWHFVNDSPEVKLQPPAWERLGDVAARTLVVVGELDLADFRAVAARVAREVPRAQTEVMPGVGHMANMEAPARFQEVLSAFLAH
jgi:3-oxoadipate enol-lactonase